MVAWVRIAGILAVAALAATAPSAHGQALPDVHVEPPFDLGFAQRDGRWYLGFDAEARNVGPGALRIRGTGTGNGTMAAAQLSGDGTVVLNPHVGTMQYVADPTHSHWHLLEFMRYRLQGVDHGAVLRDQKQGFCLAGDPPAPFVSGWCAQYEPLLTTTEIGLLPGGREVYTRWVEGQEIPIDRATAPPGRYLLSARIGVTGVLRETRTRNNLATTLVRLRWSQRTGQPRVRLLRSDRAMCVGARCPGTLPAASGHAARTLARRALRRVLGPLPRRLRRRCAVRNDRAHVCRVRVRSDRLRFAGSVRIWYVVRRGGTKWYFTLNGTRTRPGCGGSCTRRIRRARRRGGTIARTAPTVRSQAGAALVCTLSR